MSPKALENLERQAKELSAPHVMHGDCGGKVLLKRVRSLKRAAARLGFGSEKVQIRFLELWDHCTGLREFYAVGREEEIVLEFFKYLKLIWGTIREKAAGAKKHADLCQMLAYLETYLDCGVIVARRAVVQHRLELLAECRFYALNIMPLLACIVHCFLEVTGEESPAWEKFHEAVLRLCGDIRRIIIEDISPAVTTLNRSYIQELQAASVKSQLSLVNDLKAGALITRKVVIVRYGIAGLVLAVAIIAEEGCNG